MARLVQKIIGKSSDDSLLLEAFFGPQLIADDLGAWGPRFQTPSQKSAVPITQLIHRIVTTPPHRAPAAQDGIQAEQHSGLVRRGRARN